MIRTSICKGNICLSSIATGTQGNILAFLTGVTVLAVALVIINKSLNI